MNKKIIFLAVVFIISIASVSASEDVDNYIGSENQNFAMLNDEIQFSDNINLTGDVVRDGNDEDIIIPDYRNITIEGNGHNINANKLGRSFVIQSTSTLTFINVTFINGDAFPASYIFSEDGGAILNLQKQLCP